MNRPNWLRPAFAFISAILMIVGIGGLPSGFDWWGTAFGDVWDVVERSPVSAALLLLGLVMLSVAGAPHFPLVLPGIAVSDARLERRLRQWVTELGWAVSTEPPNEKVATLALVCEARDAARPAKVLISRSVDDPHRVEVHTTMIFDFTDQDSDTKLRIRFRLAVELARAGFTGFGLVSSGPDELTANFGNRIRLDSLTKDEIERAFADARKGLILVERTKDLVLLELGLSSLEYPVDAAPDSATK